MNTFGELCRHFQPEVMELCLRECVAERRPVFYVDEYEEFDDPCGFCGLRQRLFSNFDYSQAGTAGDCWPNNNRDPTCGEPQCLEFSEFFNGPKGRYRRKRFRLHYRAEPEWFYPVELRVTAMLAAMLEWEAWTMSHSGGKNGRQQQSA